MHCEFCLTCRQPCGAVCLVMQVLLFNLGLDISAPHLHMRTESYSLLSEASSKITLFPVPAILPGYYVSLECENRPQTWLRPRSLSLLLLSMKVPPKSMIICRTKAYLHLPSLKTALSTLASSVKTFEKLARWRWKQASSSTISSSVQRCSLWSLLTPGWDSI